MNIDYLHNSSRRVSRQVSRVATRALNNFYYQKFATIAWCVAMLICFAFFIGGISSSSSNASQTVTVVNNCLLYAIQQPIFNLTSSSQNQTIQVQFGKGFVVPANNSCQSAVIQGVAAIMFVLFLTMVTCVYLYSSPKKAIAQAVAYMSIILTFFTVTITAVANIGLYQTCANSNFCTNGDANFQTNYTLVFGSIVSGWAASALLFVFTSCAWFTVGTHSSNQAGSFFNSTFGRPTSITASESASVRGTSPDPADRDNRSSRAYYDAKRASGMSDLPTAAYIAERKAANAKRASMAMSEQQQLPAWRNLQINTGSTLNQDHRLTSTSALRDEL